jgi:hypothetical protein
VLFFSGKFGYDRLASGQRALTRAPNGTTSMKGRMPSTLLQRPARFVVGLNFTAVLAPVLDKAKACVPHVLAVGIGGAESEAAL